MNRVSEQSADFSTMRYRSRAMCFYIEDSRLVRYRIWVSRGERWVYIHNFAGMLTGNGGGQVRLTYGPSFQKVLPLFGNIKDVSQCYCRTGTFANGWPL